MRGLTGLRTLVTGANGGIGSCLASRLVTEGGVVAVTDIAAPRIDGAAFSAAADLTDPDSVAELAASAGDALGGIEALAAVAGIQASGPTHELAPDVFRQVIEVNVMGTFLITRA